MDIPDVLKRDSKMKNAKKKQKNKTKHVSLNSIKLVRNESKRNMIDKENYEHRIII